MFIRVLFLGAVLVAIAGVVGGSMSHGSATWTVTSTSGEDTPSSSLMGILGNGFSNLKNGGALLQKNRVKGPQDLDIFFPNLPGNCGGMSTSTCSHICGLLGYPVYWCYPKVCVCHFGNREQMLQMPNGGDNETNEV